MRCYIREKMIFHGNYLDVQVFPVFSDSKPKGARRRKAKPTSEVQQKLNERNAKKHYVHLINENFTPADLALHLTYDQFHLPATFEDADKEEANFRRRAKRAFDKLGIEFKYFSALEQGEKSGRCHHHMIIPGGLSVQQLAEIWGKGYIQVKPLQFNEFGITDLTNYITKETVGRKRLSHSRNLKQPKEKQRDGKISQKLLKEFHNYDCDVNEVCKKLYPEYDLAEIEPYYNDVNGYYYTTIRLYKPEIFKKRGRRRGYTYEQAGA